MGPNPVREARPTDGPRLRAIQTVALAEPWPELLELGLDGPPLCLVYADPDPTAYALAVVDDASSEDGVEVDDGADADDRIHAGGEEDGEDEGREDDDDEATAYLAELAVADGHRGEGQGSALLSALIQRLRGRDVERLRLTARADDERVRSFYRSHGFTVEEALPDHYDGGDGVLLTRDL